jgi:hypothetical protein
MARPPGRPRLDKTDTTTRVTVSLPTRHYDRVHQQAHQQRISIGEAIRRQLQVDDDDDRDD